MLDRQKKENKNKKLHCMRSMDSSMVLLNSKVDTGHNSSTWRNSCTLASNSSGIYSTKRKTKQKKSNKKEKKNNHPQSAFHHKFLILKKNNKNTRNCFNDKMRFFNTFRDFFFAFDRFRGFHEHRTRQKPQSKHGKKQFVRCGREFFRCFGFCIKKKHLNSQKWKIQSNCSVVTIE